MRFNKITQEMSSNKNQGLVLTHSNIYSQGSKESSEGKQNKQLVTQAGIACDIKPKQSQMAFHTRDIPTFEYQNSR